MTEDGPRNAIFLSGPVGAGKTTLGRALAERLAGPDAFIDGDDHQAPGRPWYGSILSTSRGIVRAAVRVLARRPVVVIAYPLRRREWVFHRRHLAAAGIGTVFVTLRAPYAAIVAPGRGRTFSAGERDRIAAMLAEGYAERPFSDLVVDTDRDIAASLDMLEAGVRACLQR